MRKIACWASTYPWTARFLIAFLYLPLNIAGIALGDVLFDFGIELPSYLLYTACVIALATIAYYPSRRYAWFNKNFFIKRKAADFLLLFSTVCMIVFTGNHLNSSQNYSFITPAGGFASINSSKAFTTNTSVQPKKPAGTTVTKKQLRKKVVSLFKSLRKKYKDMPDGVRILYVLLLIFILAVTVYLILGLACAISCGGLEAIGYLLLFLGIGLGIFVSFLIVKKLSRNSPKNRQIKPPPSERS